MPIESLPAALQHWQNFYMLAGAAAATLTGLMFVAVTFGSSLVTKETAQSTRAFLDPTYMHFVQVLLTSCVVTIPTLGTCVLGCGLMVAATMRLIGLHWVFRRYQEAHRTYGDVELSDWLGSIAVPLLCYLLLLATGIGFILRKSVALDGLAVVVLTLLLLGIQSAWELLVWMALKVSQRRWADGLRLPPSVKPPEDSADVPRSRGRDLP